MQSITLIQPRHIYAPDPLDEKFGHIYMPTSLLTIGSILLNAHIDVSIHDENLNDFVINNNIIGVNLIGSPYIPYAVDLSNKLEAKFGKKNYKLILGGQVVSGLTDKQRQFLFGSDSINGNNFDALSDILNIDKKKFVSPQKISLIEGYSKIDPNQLKLYLSTEFCLYLSQGCKFSCSFCGAHRSRFNYHTKTFSKCHEVYRDSNIILKDLEYLIQKSIDFGINKLNIYLSNLDLFQSPNLLLEFTLQVLNLRSKYKEFIINFRGLSNVRSFLRTHNNNSTLIHDMVKAGLYRIGFGIDGANPRIWKSTHKPQTLFECTETIRIARLVYGITPELLMVFGYNNIEDENSLKHSFDFLSEMIDLYNALPRPHVAKEIIPFSDAWFQEKNRDIVNKLLNYPILFQNLDFTAIPSEISHKDLVFRTLVTEYYLKMCELPSSLTQFVKPIDINMSQSEIKEIKNFNLGRYDF